MCEYMQTGKLRFCVATVSFLQLAIVLYDSVGLCQQCYVFVLPGNIKTFVKKLSHVTL